MVSICFYFQVHQPYRLRRYSVFDTDPFYFDNAKNMEICRRVADLCYRPTTRLLIDLCQRFHPDFRVSFSLSGTVLDQFEAFCPDVIELFQQLVATGCCELLAEPYDHSLAFLYSRDEFVEQVDRHTQRLQSLFGVTPRVFCNTELIYNNDLAAFLHQMGRFHGALCEGVDRILGYRTPNIAYRPPNIPAADAGSPLTLLLKNYRLSDDIAFRFSNQDWEDWPLTPAKFVDSISRIEGSGSTCNLFLDYETFGEHQNTETGIHDFLAQLPEAALSAGSLNFRTPSQVIEESDPQEAYDVPHMISWADTERDLSAWIGNAMQANALHELYRLERAIKDKLDSAESTEQEQHASYILEDWHKLTASDHVYYMCTKHFADGVVHQYFNPYASPYDGYINFMNVLDNLRTRLTRTPQHTIHTKAQASQAAQA
jgi:alpha-amylase